MQVTRRQWFFRAIIVLMIVGVIVRQYIKYKVAPELELTQIEFVTLDGQPFDPAQWKGKNVLLTVFATWCGPCKAEVEPMEMARPQLEAANFVMVHVTDEELGKVERFMAQHPSGFMYLRSNTPRESIGVHTIPTHFVFDTEGKLRFRQTDPLDWEAPEIVNELIETVK